jgi:L-lysine exporter family protein LysE/ArgO
MRMEFLTGFKLALSLILVIGAQNAFVLRHGVLRVHVFAVVAFCGISDAVLIGIGVWGAGAFAVNPQLQEALRIGGVLFLTWYGAKSLRSAWKGGEEMALSGDKIVPLGATLATLAALTWLNPHVWLDTVVLIGAVSAQFPRPWLFGIGAASGSLVFFTALGYGARRLAPLFALPRAWQVLDVCVAILMWSIAFKLAISG